MAAAPRIVGALVTDKAGVVRVARAGSGEHFRIILGSGILIFDHHGNGSPIGHTVGDTAQDHRQVRFLSLRGGQVLSGSASVLKCQQLVLINSESSGESIQDHAYPFSM